MTHYIRKRHGLKMDPTPAQLEYLENARDMCDMGTGKGKFFYLAGAGSLSACRACLRRGWIQGHWGPICVTPAGRAVLKEQS